MEKAGRRSRFRLFRRRPETSKHDPNIDQLSPIEPQDQPPTLNTQALPSTPEVTDISANHAYEPDTAPKLRALGLSRKQVKDWAQLDLPVEVVEEWLHLNLDGDLALALAERHQKPASVQGWLDQGFDLSDAILWIDHGFSDSSLAASWNQADFSPSASSEWVASGITFPHIAVGWRSRSLGPSFARSLLASMLESSPTVDDSSGFTWRPSLEFLQQVDPDLVRQWHLAPISREASVWAQRHDWVLARCGPEEAFEWTHLGIDVANVKKFTSKGIRAKHVQDFASQGLIGHGDENVLLTLVEIGATLAPELVDWLVSSSATLRDLINATSSLGTIEAFNELAEAGLSFGQAQVWLQGGFTSSEITEWLKVGVCEPEWATHWTGAGQTPTSYQRIVSSGELEGIRSWQDSGFSPKEMSEWNSVGVRSIDHARDWRIVRISASEAKDWIEIGVTSPAIVRQWKSLGQSPQEAHNWKAHSLGPDDFLRLKGVLPSSAEAPQWRPIPPPPLSPYRQLTPASLPSRIIRSSGLHTSSSIPSRSGPSRQTFDDWLATGRQHIDAVGGRKQIGDEFLRFLFSRDLRWSESSDNPFQFTPNERWLKEIQHRAELLRDRIRITISQPALFDGGDVQIALVTRGNNAFAWVGQSSRGLLTAFSLPNCRPKTSTNQLGHRAALGLAIAWFLDISVSLRTSSRSVREHPHFSSRATDGSPGVAHIRYVPTPRFEEHRRSISRGSFTPRPTHQVEGHVRTLPPGWEPTIEARNNAPGYMDLGPNETFVRAHVRGIEAAADELTRRLSKYSALAEALGLFELRR